MIVVALAKPRQAIAPIFTTMIATAFAATISSPICPRIEAKTELARLQTTSFTTEGAAILIKSDIKTPVLANKYLTRNLIPLLTREYIRQIKTSTIRAITVPRATPVTPSFGSPNNPNINEALQTTFTQSEMMYIVEGRRTFPTLLSALINICENPIKINEKEITLRYWLPAAIVSGLLVNIPIIEAGKEKDITKKTSDTIMDRRSARPIIFSTVLLSPFPKYWAHKTEVPAESP